MHGIKVSTTHALFQSTLPRGERPTAISHQYQVNEFQSTLPRGERRKLIAAVNAETSFQSTLPRGERLKRKF